MKQRFSTYIDQLQDRICSALEKIDGAAHFQIDNWERPAEVEDSREFLKMEQYLKKAGSMYPRFMVTTEPMKAYLK